MNAIDLLKAQIAKNESQRIAKDANELTRPKILHTQYLGDRTVRQLGQEPIENAVILNNASNTIGDALMPLAKGAPLQRFDSVNQDDGVGTAKRAILDAEANRAQSSDFAANGISTIKTRTGEQFPSNNPLDGTPRGNDPLPQTYPPPFGCVPVGGGGNNCIWTASPTPPTDYQSHGGAVINQDGLELYLHCKNGVVPPSDLGCDFINKWQCSGGICYQIPTGIYNSQNECEAALIRVYALYIKASVFKDGVYQGTLSAVNGDAPDLFVGIDVFTFAILSFNPYASVGAIPAGLAVTTTDGTTNHPVVSYGAGFVTTFTVSDSRIDIVSSTCP
jgi:hypothetical protein